MPIFQTVSGVELFWLFTTGVCLFLMVGFFLETRRDKIFNELHGVNGSAKIVAESGIRRQGIKVLITILLFIASALSAAFETPSPEYIRAIILLCLSGVPIFLLILNIVDRLERTALIDYFQNITPTERRKETEDAIQKQETDAQDVRDSEAEADRKKMG